MKLITTNDQLIAFIPNNIATVKGEIPFIDRMSVFLDLAESWLVATFTGSAIFDGICSGEHGDELKLVASRLVVADAMRRAIPSLDIVLTPNGFAVVNTNNLAPASKPRTDRFVGSMLTQRDETIGALLKLLPSVDGWTSTPQGEFFGATLFPNLDVIDQIGGSGNSTKWDKFLELRPMIIAAEISLAEGWFSQELMAALRSEVVSNSLTPLRRSVATRIITQVLLVLKGSVHNVRALQDTVNVIRVNDAYFPEWHKSNVKKLFDPPIFKNKKQSSGYFF